MDQAASDRLLRQVFLVLNVPIDASPHFKMALEFQESLREDVADALQAFPHERIHRGTDLRAGWLLQVPKDRIRVTEMISGVCVHLICAIDADFNLLQVMVERHQVVS